MAFTEKFQAYIIPRMSLQSGPPAVMDVPIDAADAPIEPALACDSDDEDWEVAVVEAGDRIAATFPPKAA